MDINLGGPDTRTRGEVGGICVASMVLESMVAKSRVMTGAGEGVPEVLGGCVVRTWMRGEGASRTTWKC